MANRNQAKKVKHRYYSLGQSLFDRGFTWRELRIWTHALGDKARGEVEHGWEVQNNAQDAKLFLEDAKRRNSTTRMCIRLYYHRQYLHTQRTG